ncbi:MAG TPA: hypothetical protein VKD71_09430 [Gemmataceae bacterium]|nr:hypothetical protein [Gemmataceae bacterium]
MRDEPPVEAADIFIRNWRPIRWRLRCICAGFALAWIGLIGSLFFLPTSQIQLYALAVFLPLLLISMCTFTWVVTRNPIDRLRLGDDIGAFPRGLYARTRISHIELGPDPAEDYVEKPVPVPLCALTVVVDNAAPLKMIVSRGDALRLKEWASRHHVEVRDPLQSARLPEEPRTTF